jgi:hypothetical protein
MTVPDAFAADVQRAAARGERGTLMLLGQEALAESWGDAGLRLAMAAAGALPPPTPVDHVLLFTGHMVDAPGRHPPRFPRTAAAEGAARQLIEGALKDHVRPDERTVGIAGGACGGDLLFHEACRAAGVATRLLLALPARQFERTSVEPGGTQWVDRFRALCAASPPFVLQPDPAAPAWRSPPAYDLWQRNNHWLLCGALALGAARRTAIALHNPDLDADGPGGTVHLLSEARSRGFDCVALDARALLDASVLPSP